MAGSKKRKRKQGYKADYGDATPEQVALALLTYRRDPKPEESALGPSLPKSMEKEEVDYGKNK